MKPRASNRRKIYISDLDGTLLRNDASLSTFSRDVLDELLNNGLLFTVASARSVETISKILAGLRLQLPVIEFNGAFITDLDTGQHQVIHNIEPVVVEHIYEVIKSEFRCTPFISTFNGTEDCLYYSDIDNEGMQWYLGDRLQQGDKRLRFIENLASALRDQVVCLTVIGSKEQLTELRGAIEEHHPTSVQTHLIENQYSAGWYWLTIHHWQATKDQAIRVVLETYNLDKDELIVFGDNDNDVTMFQLSDRAIAVANATEQLKGVATQVIGSNTEDSVVKFIRDDWSNPLSHRQVS